MMSIGRSAVFATAFAAASFIGFAGFTGIEPAQAQATLGNQKPLTPLQMQAEEEAKRRAENDRAYQATVRRSQGDAPPPVTDPWASVREQPQKKK